MYWPCATVLLEMTHSFRLTVRIWFFYSSQWAKLPTLLLSLLSWSLAAKTLGLMHSWFLLGVQPHTSLCQVTNKWMESTVAVVHLISSIYICFLICRNWSWRTWSQVWKQWYWPWLPEDEQHQNSKSQYAYEALSSQWSDFESTPCSSLGASSYSQAFWMVIPLYRWSQMVPMYLLRMIRFFMRVYWECAPLCHLTHQWVWQGLLPLPSATAVSGDNQRWSLSELISNDGSLF